LKGDGKVNGRFELVAERDELRRGRDLVVPGSRASKLFNAKEVGSGLFAGDPMKPTSL
jgi:hypothetical protein